MERAPEKGTSRTEHCPVRREDSRMTPTIKCEFTPAPPDFATSFRNFVIYQMQSPGDVTNDSLLVRIQFCPNVRQRLQKPDRIIAGGGTQPAGQIVADAFFLPAGKIECQDIVRAVCEHGRGLLIAQIDCQFADGPGGLTGSGKVLCLIELRTGQKQDRTLCSAYVGGRCFQLGGQLMNLGDQCGRSGVHRSWVAKGSNRGCVVELS